MGLFKRRPDPFTVAVSIVEQFRSGDPAAAQRGIDMIESVSVGDVLAGLIVFGQAVSSQWKPEQIELIKNEYAAASGRPDVCQAVKDAGPLLLIAPDINNATQAILAALQDVEDNKAEVLNLVMIEIAAATGRIVGKLDISFR